MKKVFVIVLVLTCLLGLVGCDPGVKFLSKEDLLENTVKIELVHYENENPKPLSLKLWQKPKFDFNKVTLLATLDESRFEDLLTYVSELHYLYYARAWNEPIGKTLVLYQRNGNIIVLYGCIYTDENGHTRYPGDCYIFDENGVFVELIGDVGYLFPDYIESTYFK